MINGFQDIRAAEKLKYRIRDRLTLVHQKLVDIGASGID